MAGRLTQVSLLLNEEQAAFLRDVYAAWRTSFAENMEPHDFRAAALLAGLTLFTVPGYVGEFKRQDRIKRAMVGAPLGLLEYEQRVVTEGLLAMSRVAQDEAVTPAPEEPV